MTSSRRWTRTANPGVVLGMLAALGGTVRVIRVVGCQPATLEDGIGLSSPVAAAVDDAVTVVKQVVDEICGTAGKGSKNMMRRLVVLALLVGAAIVIKDNLPDMTRYLKIREM